MSFISIAIAEDHTMVRRGLIEIIDKFNGCKIITDAANGLELINNISKLHSLPDICIIDISMPELDGYQTISELKKLYPSMKFLVLSMHNNEFCIIEMIKRGANGYLLKNSSPKELNEALIRIYNNEYYYSKTASEKAFKIVKNNKLPELNEKELQFIRLCGTELTFEEIGIIMFVSSRTVEGYQKHIGEKLNIKSRTGLALFAIKSGLIPLNIK